MSTMSATSTSAPATRPMTAMCRECHTIIIVPECDHIRDLRACPTCEVVSWKRER